METNGTLGDKILPKFCSKFYCNFCDYGTSKKSSYSDHILSAKHKKKQLGDAQITNSAASLLNETNFTCEFCQKKYISRNGLWKHKKNCNNECNDISDKELLAMIIKQNTELLNVIKSGTINTINSNNTNTNSNNKTFNLQFFLNETCKDAINISDFVSSIKPQLAELEKTGRIGYVEGVSNIIMNNLNTLHIPDRPIHCSDIKREIIYIKDNNEWTKEGEDKPILTKAIKMIANENIKNISEWKKANPDCTDSDSKKNNLYLKIVSNSMSGSTAEESSKNINKIISNIAKEVVIKK